MNFGLIILNQSIGTMQKLCYTDTDSFTIHIKTEYLYKDIVDNVEKNLIHQIMKSKDHCLKERIKK